MKQKRRVRIAVEQLEQRWVPATVRFVSGYLLISPSSGESAMNLTVKQATVNSFTVTDGASGLGTYSGVANILITGANGADTVTVNLNGLAYAGNLTANTGDGNDTVNITGGGAILGNVGLNTGFGNDSVALAATGAAGIHFGGTVQVTDLTGANTLTVGNGAASSFGGDLSATGYNTVTLGNGTGAIAFGGNVTVNDGSVSLGAKITVSNGVTVNKALNITTGPGADTISLGNDTVTGNTQINTGSGNDTVTDTGAAPLFGGNLTISSTGSGNDSVNLSPGAGTVGGTLSVTLGDGTDTVTLNSTLNVNGDLRMTLGNGNDSVTVDSLVNGNMFWSEGNGTDTITIGNAPGGVLNWTSGNGNDSVTLGDATNAAGETWNVHMQFGTGNDTLTLAGNGTVAAPEALTGFIDMGGPPGGNSFDPTGSLAAGTWVIVSPFTLQNV
jgi:hypothetical protein